MERGGRGRGTGAGEIIGGRGALIQHRIPSKKQEGWSRLEFENGCVLQCNQSKCLQN